MLAVATDPNLRPAHLNGGAVRPAFFRRGDQAELADAALADILAGRSRDYALYDAGDVHIYAPGLGIWELVPDYQVRSVVKSFAGFELDDGGGKRGKGDPSVVKVGASTTVGAYALLRDDLLTAADERGGAKFASARRGLCFRNGFVTAHGGTIELLSHAPEHLARHRYEFDYDPNLVPSAFLLFLDSLFRDQKPQEHADRIALVQEFVGACLLGEATRYQRCLVVYATGGNGKSELMTVVEGLFPPGTVTSLPPHRWSHNFRVMMLEGRLINLVDEMPSDDLASGESFKKIITGGIVDAERKHRDPVTFRPVAGHIFNANQPIRSGDQSDGFWRRPLILALTRVFESADYTAPDLERGIGARILAEGIAPLVNWAIEGAARLQRTGRYTEPASSRAYVRAWREDSDQVRSFVLDHPITTRIASSALYESYSAWAKTNGHKPLSRPSFGHRLVSAGLAARIKASSAFYEPPIDPAEVLEREGMQSDEDRDAEEREKTWHAAEEERLRCG